MPINVNVMLQRLLVFLSPIFLFFVINGCKTSENATNKSAINNKQDTTKTRGIVTHQYKNLGCSTIIICKTKNSNDTLFLIPAVPIDDFDKDGLEILFNYRIVKIHNPKGCSKGIPAQILNIEIKKIK